MNIPEHIRAEFKIKFESLKDAEVVLKTIEPEIQSAPSDRSSVNLNLNGNILKLVIDAEDTPSLRASINSYLRWIILSCDVQNLKSSNL
jgi:KEOPS complex subunit Pcc1